MKDFLRTMLIEPFKDRDWIGGILGVLMWFIFLLFTGLLLWGMLWLIDSSYLPIKQKEGVVTNKSYSPAYTTTNMIMVGKVMIPTTQYHDEEYDIEITIDGLTDNVSLYQDYWNTVKVGDKWCCKYTNGRILNSLYIKSFCK
jgi:hypothetical protein